MALSSHRNTTRNDGHGVQRSSRNTGRSNVHEQQYYHTHWEVSEEEGGEVIAEEDEEEEDDDDVNRLRTERNHLAEYNLQQQSQRQQQHKHASFSHDVVGMDVGSRSDRNNIIMMTTSPRQKFNVEFDYEDNIETTSSGSFSSGYGRPSSHHHRPPSHPHHHHQHHSAHHQEAQVRYFVDSGGGARTANNLSARHNNMMNNKGAYGGPRTADIPEKFRDEKDGSEIYVVDTAYMKPPASVYSHYSGKSRAPSEMSSVKTKTSRKGGVVVETMAAPNPCCPNTKGVCWLLVLVNLGLILVTLGFSIVLQLFDPPFVWYFGIAFLIVGFIALIASLIFCLHFCRESEEARRRGLQPGEMYWTHHWQKRIALPGMTRHETEKVPDDVSTVYSARHDPEDKYYRDDRRDMTPIHTYGHHQTQRN